MSDHTTTYTGHAHNHAGPNDWKLYLGILIALLFLTVITVAAASFDFGTMNIVIALAIASVKGSLVALFFMHLRHDRMVNSIIFLSALIFLALLLMLCMIDVNSRIEPKPYNWKGPDPGLISPAELNKPPAPLPQAGAGADATGSAPAASPGMQPPAADTPKPH